MRPVTTISRCAAFHRGSPVSARSICSMTFKFLRQLPKNHKFHIPSNRENDENQPKFGPMDSDCDLEIINI
uniref:Uncharacterized protein n=1 Tax=Romanomermis culicivorax TaxID=13658 RepID=A0A915JUA8_ROMCU